LFRTVSHIGANYSFFGIILRIFAIFPNFFLFFYALQNLKCIDFLHLLKFLNLNIIVNLWVQWWIALDAQVLLNILLLLQHLLLLLFRNCPCVRLGLLSKFDCKDTILDFFRVKDLYSPFGICSGLFRTISHSLINCIHFKIHEFTLKSRELFFVI